MPRARERVEQFADAALEVLKDCNAANQPTGEMVSLVKDLVRALENCDALERGARPDSGGQAKAKPIAPFAKGAKRA